MLHSRDLPVFPIVRWPGRTRHQNYTEISHRYPSLNFSTDAGGTRKYLQKNAQYA